MVVRKIIRIDEEKCDGCGLCVTACHEGAIQLVEGKARLISETYCDGLGDCLAECPQDAITIEERNAKDFDEEAVKEHLTRQKEPSKPLPPHPVGGGCPGAALRNFKRQAPPPGVAGKSDTPSQLGHWPVQLMLVPPGAPFLKGADILVCADCVPFAVPDFHSRYLAGKAVLVGCPKLDDLQYYHDKLKAIFAEAEPRSLTVLKMEVPCCGGIAQAAMEARDEVRPDTEIQVYTVGIQGDELQCDKIEAGTLCRS